MTFDSLGLSADLVRMVAEEGYTSPTPVQESAIPLVLAGRDVLAAAQTGTGKTAAFVLPILDRLRHQANTCFSPARHPVRVLILVPTRELAMQVDESVRTYGRTVPLRSTVVYGGIPMDPQIKALRGGIEILVATPGRLLDLVGQKVANLGQVEILVLDEADRMLDMGFLPDIQKIIALLPAKRQNLMFSATFSDDIRRLSGGILRDPATVEVAPRNTTLEAIRQLVYPVDRDRKEALLAHLIRKNDMRQVLVFTRTKLAATRLANRLDREGLDAVAIHSDRSQPERTRALEGFKNGEIRVLVATDVAARGLDIEDLPARRQLRAAVEPAGLHPPHRADRAGGRDRRGDLAGLHRRDRPAARRPADAQAGDPVDRRGGLHPRPEHRAATARGSRGSRPDQPGAPRPSQAGPPARGRRERPLARQRLDAAAAPRPVRRPSRSDRPSRPGRRSRASIRPGCARPRSD